MLHNSALPLVRFDGPTWNETRSLNNHQCSTLSRQGTGRDESLPIHTTLFLSYGLRMYSVNTDTVFPYNRRNLYTRHCSPLIIGSYFLVLYRSRDSTSDGLAHSSPVSVIRPIAYIYQLVSLECLLRNTSTMVYDKWPVMSLGKECDVVLIVVDRQRRHR